MAGGDGRRVPLGQNTRAARGSCATPRRSGTEACLRLRRAAGGWPLGRRTRGTPPTRREDRSRSDRGLLLVRAHPARATHIDHRLRRSGPTTARMARAPDDAKLQSSRTAAAAGIRRHAWRSPRPQPAPPERTYAPPLEAGGNGRWRRRVARMSRLGAMSGATGDWREASDAFSGLAQVLPHVTLPPLKRRYCRPACRPGTARRASRPSGPLDQGHRHASESPGHPVRQARNATKAATPARSVRPSPTKRRLRRRSSFEAPSE